MCLYFDHEKLEKRCKDPNFVLFVAAIGMIIRRISTMFAKNAKRVQMECQEGYQPSLWKMEKHILSMSA